MLEFEEFDALGAADPFDVTMPVVEHFVSVNGEGAHAGQFSTFVRFAGCNLSCSYCDTSWACDPACDSTAMTPRAITTYVRAQGTPCVTLTGGEPALQPALPLLLEDLVRHTDCFVEIETNGAVDLTALDELRTHLADEGFADRIGFTMDWKAPSSGMADFMHPENLATLGPLDCLKFVVGSTEDLDDARTLLEQTDLTKRCAVIFSPVFGAIEAADIVAYLQHNDLLDARVQLQLHKLIWPDVDRGV